MPAPPSLDAGSQTAPTDGDLTIRLKDTEPPSPEPSEDASKQVPSASGDRSTLRPGNT